MYWLIILEYIINNILKMKRMLKKLQSYISLSPVHNLFKKIKISWINNNHMLYYTIPLTAAVILVLCHMNVKNKLKVTFFPLFLGLWQVSFNEATCTRLFACLILAQWWQRCYSEVCSKVSKLSTTLVFYFITYTHTHTHNYNDVIIW